MSGRAAAVAVVAVLAAGTALRLLFVGEPGYRSDVSAFLTWAERLTAIGPVGTYDPRYFVDYPPGYLYVLWLFGALFDGEALRIAIKGASIPADIGVAVAAAAFLWRRDLRAAVLAAALWALSPVAIFAGAYWGQIDALGVLPLAAALVAAGHRRWGLSGALAGVAAMIKFQFGLGFVVCGAAAAITAGRARDLRPVARFGVSAFAVVTALGVVAGLTPLRTFELALRAADGYHLASLFAFNGWSIVAGHMTDDAPYFLPGGVLLVAGLSAAAATLWRRRDAEALLAAGALATFAFYFLPTRAHERYIIPALVMLLPLAATRRAVLLPYLLLTAEIFISFYPAFLYAGYIRLPGALDEFVRSRGFEVTLAIAMIATAGTLAVVLARQVLFQPPPKAEAPRHQALRMTPRRWPPGLSRPRVSFAGAPSLEQLLAIVVVLKVAGLTLLLAPGGLSVFDLPKSVWSRAAAWLTVALLVALAARGAAFPRTRLHAAVAMLLGATALSAAFAEHPYTALFGERTRYLGLSFTADMVTLYLATAMAWRSRLARPMLLGGAAVIAAAAYAYGLAQLARVDPISWGPGVLLRPFSTFGNPDMYGHFLAVSASAALAGALYSSGRVRILLLGFGAGALALIPAVATRGALLGLLFAVVPVVALVVRERGRSALRPLALAGAAALALTAAILATTPLGTRLASVLTGSETAERLVIWDGAWRLFLLRPIVGAGPDNLGAAYHQVRLAGTEPAHAGAVLVDQSHNWVLHQLATTGLLGTAALLGVMIGTVVLLWRAFPRERAVAAAALAASAAYWGQGLVAVESVSVGWIPWVVAGLAAGSATRTLPLPRRERVRRLGVPVIAVGCLALAVLAGNAARADLAIGRAADAYARGDAGRATDLANEALALDPGRGEYWNYRGLARGLRGLWAIAADDYEEAWRRAPHQTNFLANVAFARMRQAQAGDAPAAARAYAAARRAVAIEPNLSSTHRALAVVALGLGDPALALDESVVAMRLNPQRTDADQIAADAARLDPDRAHAQARLREAVKIRDSPALRAALAQAEAR